MTATTSTTASRTERLDHLPLSRKHLRLLGGSGIGWALDAMDVGLISFIMAALAAHWGLNATQTSWLGSIGFVGMALGAALGGLLADKFGRRKVFALTLLVYGLATGASALSAGLGTLLALRFIVGLGLGAELPVASTLVSEFSPRSIRGRMVVILEAFWAIGWIAAALIGTFVVTASPDGWRWALALGCIPALYALAVRFGFPESVRFLESRGRHQEVETIVRSFEEASGQDWRSESEHSTQPARTAEPSKSSGAESVWSPRLRQRTLAFWIIWFCINLSYYGAFIWIPSLLHAQGYTLVKSFSFTLVMTLAQIPGYALSALLIERWGRRSTLATFLIGSAGAAALFGVSTSDWSIIFTGCLLSFFNLGAWGALYAIGPELYPTAIRGTGTGAAAGFGRIASIIAPLIAPPILLLGGPLALFSLFAAAFLAAAFAALALPELRGRALE